MNSSQFAFALALGVATLFCPAPSAAGNDDCGEPLAAAVLFERVVTAMPPSNLRRVRFVGNPDDRRLLITVPEEGLVAPGRGWERFREGFRFVVDLGRGLPFFSHLATVQRLRERRQGADIRFEWNGFVDNVPHERFHPGAGYFPVTDQVHLFLRVDFALTGKPERLTSARITVWRTGGFWSWAKLASFSLF